MQQVILVSGPPGAGKTAVAEAICERFDRMVHIEVDGLRHAVKAGYRHPWAGDAQAEEQLALAVRNACAVARECVAARYAVVIDDVVPVAQAARYEQALTGVGALVHLVTLLPDATALRVGGGASDDPRREQLRALLAQQAQAGELPGVTLDTSADADAQVTTDRVMDIVASGAALLLRPEPAARA